VGALAGIVIAIVVVSVLLYKVYTWRIQTKQKNQFPVRGGGRGNLLSQDDDDDYFGVAQNPVNQSY
jgi:hypothetical protein